MFMDSVLRTVADMNPRVIRFVLLGLCAGFASVIAVEVTLALTSGATVERPGRNSAALLSKHSETDTSALIAEILERPLFSPDRNAKDPESAAAERVQEKEPPQLESRLTGIMIGPQGREALFQQGDGNFAALKEGGEIDGWKVTAIRNAEVVLSSEFGNQVVGVTDGEGGAAPPARKKPLATKVNATKPAAGAANAGKAPGPAQVAAGAKPKALASAPKGAK
jgi:hypothetical protein